MPKRTKELLEQLHNLGFSDEDLRIVHHRKDDSPSHPVTIRSMKKYCEEIKTEFLTDGTNEKVRKRLELVLAAFKVGFSKSGVERGVFHWLANAAKAEIPID